MLRNFKRFLLLGLLSCSMSIASCSKDEPEPTSPNNPVDEIPVAEFMYALNGLEVDFTFSGSSAASFEWDFGDSTKSEDESPSHTYDRYGVYRVQLTAKNGVNETTTEEIIEVDAESIVPIPQLDMPSYDGAFYAINYQRDWIIEGDEQRIRTGAAIAWCRGLVGYVDVGEVEFQQTTYQGLLALGEDNVYTWEEAQGERVGFKNDGGPMWSIEGGAGHGFINGLTNAWPFPKVGAVGWTASGGGSLKDITASATLKDADTVIYTIHGPDGSVLIGGGSTTTTVTFDGDDLINAGPGAGTLTATGYKLYEQTLGDKTYRVLNVVSSQTNVTIE